MKTKTILSILIVTFISVLFFSCDNNMVNSSDVSGKIYYGDYYPAVNVKVTIGDAVTTTAGDGSFKIKNVSYPYNISLLDSNRGYVSIFKKLSTDILNLSMDNNSGGNFSASFKVRVPDSLMTNGKKGKLIFTDGEYINSYFDMFYYSSNYIFDVNLPDVNHVTGKLLLLTYRLNNFGNIYSYENFGMKTNLNIIAGLIYNYTFDSTEISLDPGEEIISGTVIPTNNYNETGSAYVLSFTNKKISDINGSNYFGDASGILYDMIVPTGLPIQYTTYVFKEFGNGQNYTAEMFPVYPYSPNTFEMKLPPALITPQDNAANVSNTTLFNFSEGTGNGIFEIYLTDRSRNIRYRIITASNNFTLDDIDYSGFGSVSNHDFEWTVRKSGVYNSINEYAVNRYNNSNWFFGTSGYRRFSTQP